MNTVITPSPELKRLEDILEVLRTIAYGELTTAETRILRFALAGTNMKLILTGPDDEIGFTPNDPFGSLTEYGSFCLSRYGR